MSDYNDKRVDVEEKVTGTAKYAGDLMFDNLLHLKVLRSPYAHAKIIDIDIQSATKSPEVVKAFTYKDIPGIAGQDKERPVLAKDTVRYAGDGVVLVAAENEDVAINALKQIKIKYQELPSVFEPEAALEPGAPIIHEDSNLVCHYKVRKGSVDIGFSEADLTIERTFSTHRVQHAAIEPEAAVAVPSIKGVTVYCPCKSPFNVRRVVAETLNMTVNQVRLIQTTVGGSFGGKDYDMSVMASRAALAAVITNRPCKIVYTREESTIEGTKRHPYKMTYKVGAKKNGKLTAMEISIIGDAGSYLSKSAMVAWRSAVEATGPYDIPNVKTDIKLAYTNNVYADALRGFGSPQVDYASELIMNELAQHLDINPYEIRRINALKNGSISATGQTMESVSLLKCIDELENYIGFDSVNKPIEEVDGNRKVRGKGIACIYRGESLGAGGEGIDTAGVTIHVQRDGSVTLYSGLSEVGQGGHTVLAKIAASILGIETSQISVSPVDTAYVPDSGPTVASRGTVLAGNAAKIAAEEIKEKITKVVSEYWNTTSNEYKFSKGNIYNPDNLGQFISFKDAVKLLYSKSRNAYGNGWWSAPELWWDFEKGKGDAYFSYVYGACGAEVEVDLYTGKIEVIRFVAVHDIGKAINQEEIKGQITGGVSMGIGYALLEDLNISQGVINHTNYDKYLIPTALDIHEIIPVIVEEASPQGPLGAKGLGEPATSIVAPAIINAISNALNVRIYNLPVDLESAMKSIEARSKVGVSKEN